MNESPALDDRLLRQLSLALRTLWNARLPENEHRLVGRALQALPAMVIDAWVRLADWASEREQFELVQLFHDAAFALSGGKVDPRLLLTQARALKRSGATVAAYEMLTQLRQEHPEFVPGLTAFALECHARQEWHGAVEIWEELLTRFDAKQRPSWVSRLSQALFQLGQHDRALLVLDSLFDTGLDVDDPHVGKGRLLAARIHHAEQRHLQAQRMIHSLFGTAHEDRAHAAMADMWKSLSNPRMTRFHLRAAWRMHHRPQDLAGIIASYFRESNTRAAARLFNLAILHLFSTPTIDTAALVTLCQVFVEEFGTRLYLKQHGARGVDVMFSLTIELLTQLHAQDFEGARRTDRSLRNHFGRAGLLSDAQHGLVPDTTRGADLALLRPTLVSARATQPAPQIQPVALHFVTSLGMGGLERRLLRTVQAHSASKRQIICVLDTSRPDSQAYLGSMTLGSDITLVGMDGTAADEPRWQALLTQFPELRDFDTLPDALTVIANYEPDEVYLWGLATFDRAGVACYLSRVPRVVIQDGSVAPPTRTGMNPSHHGRFRLLGELLRQFLSDPGWCMVLNGARNIPGYIAYLGDEVDVSRFYSCQKAFPEDIVAQQPSLSMDQVKALHNIDPGAPVIGYVGRLTQEKNLVLWLEVAARVHQALPAARFLIVGSGSTSDFLQDHARKLGVLVACRFVGRQSTELASYFRAMDVLLHTSDFEGLPNAVLEAQALGVPVVVRDTGGSADALAPGQSGELIAGADPELFASAVLKLLQDADLYSRYRQQAPRFIAQNCSQLGIELLPYGSLNLPSGPQSDVGVIVGSGGSGDEIDTQMQSNPALACTLLTEQVDLYERNRTMRALLAARQGAQRVLAHAEFLGPDVLVFRRLAVREQSVAESGVSSNTMVRFALLFARLAVHFPEFATPALQARAALALPWAEGGGWIGLRQGAFIEDIRSSSTPSFSLRPWLNVVISLAEYCKATPSDEQAADMLAQQLLGLEELLPCYDLPRLGAILPRLGAEFAARIRIDGHHQHKPGVLLLLPGLPARDLSDGWSGEMVEVPDFPVCLADHLITERPVLQIELQRSAQFDLTLSKSGEASGDWREALAPRALEAGIASIPLILPKPLLREMIASQTERNMQHGLATVLGDHLDHVGKLSRLFQATGYPALQPWLLRWSEYMSAWSDNPRMQGPELEALLLRAAILAERAVRQANESRKRRERQTAVS